MVVFHFWELYIKKLIFLNQRLDLTKVPHDFKPSSSWIFSVEDPLMTPAMVSVALYWSDYSLLWKDSLNALSP